MHCWATDRLGRVCDCAEVQTGRLNSGHGGLELGDEERGEWALRYGGVQLFDPIEIQHHCSTQTITCALACSLVGLFCSQPVSPMRSHLWRVDENVIDDHLRGHIPPPEYGV
jgi:hypothetical protein